MWPRWKLDGPVKENNTLEANAKDAFAQYVAKVKEWSDTYELEKLAPNGALVGDVEAIMKPVLDSFKMFFREGWPRAGVPSEDG